jgi:hypothetical protein
MYFLMFLDILQPKPSLREITIMIKTKSKIF